MKPKKTSPIWPYLGILACLFVLSVTAPRAWDRMARKESLSRALAALKSRVADEMEAPRADPVMSVVEVEPAPREAAEVEAQGIVEPEVPDAPAPVLADVRPAELSAQVPPLKQEVPSEPESVLESDENKEVPELPAPRKIAEQPDRSEQPTVDADEKAAEPEGALADEASGWPPPRALVAQLKRLAQVDPSARWAAHAKDLIGEMCRDGCGEPEQTASILKKLRQLAEPNVTTAATSASPGHASQIARTRYALARWLDIWEDASALQGAAVAKALAPASNQQMQDCLAAVDALTRKGASGAAWRKYLRLDALRRLAGAGQSDSERKALARNVLDLLTSPRLSSRQRKFVSEGPLGELQSQLRPWAAEGVTAGQFLTHLEQYEHSGLASDARRVANDYQGLKWSQPAEAARASQSLDTHYRNANFRVAIAGALANRMIPQPETLESTVQDTIVNVPVYGLSKTTTKLSVRFVPDPERIRVGLEAKGLVDSDTVSESGPATFYNEGRSTFLVRKLLVLGPRGLSVWPAVAEAENNYTYLVSLETEFDGVPLFGPLVRSIARSQIDDARGEARLEVEHKVARRAREQLDAEVRPMLLKAAERVEKQQLAVLTRLGLEFAPMGMSTTEERIVARARLAGSEQLGAHTPRPRAPADSWLSLQLHQSALNNAIEKLDLDGRELSLKELFAWIAEKLGRPQLAQQEDLPEDVQVTFAKQDAVRLKCEEGKVEVTFAFAKLTQGSRSWHDFTVRTHYLPEARELDPRFVRDRGLSFGGRSVQGKLQPLLRAIFSKVLSPKRDLSLLGDTFTSDPRLRDLQVTQFVIEDGWIGLAYSQRRTHPNVARRPATPTK